MKYICKDAANKIKNSKTCTVREYKLDRQNIDIAQVTISGRYPEDGSVKNNVSTEVCLVISGSGSIVVDKEKTLLQAGDVILIEPGEKFFWEGVMEIVISCSPAWSIEQYKQVT